MSGTLHNRQMLKIFTKVSYVAVAAAVCFVIMSLGEPGSCGPKAMFTNRQQADYFMCPNSLKNTQKSPNTMANAVFMQVTSMFLSPISYSFIGNHRFACPSMHLRLPTHYSDHVLHNMPRSLSAKLLQYVAPHLSHVPSLPLFVHTRRRGSFCLVLPLFSPDDPVS